MGVLIELVGFMIAWFLGLYGFMVVYVCHIHELYQIHHSDSLEAIFWRDPWKCKHFIKRHCFWSFFRGQVLWLGFLSNQHGQYWHHLQCVSFLYHHYQSGRLVIIQLTLFINSAIIHHAVIAINFTYELQIPLNKVVMNVLLLLGCKFMFKCKIWLQINKQCN